MPAPFIRLPQPGARTAPPPAAGAPLPPSPGTDTAGVSTPMPPYGTAGVLGPGTAGVLTPVNAQLNRFAILQQMGGGRG